MLQYVKGYSQTIGKQHLSYFSYRKCGVLTPQNKVRLAERAVFQLT